MVEEPKQVGTSHSNAAIRKREVEICSMFELVAATSAHDLWSPAESREHIGKNQVKGIRLARVKCALARARLPKGAAMAA